VEDGILDDGFDGSTDGRTDADTIADGDGYRLGALDGMNDGE